MNNKHYRRMLADTLEEISNAGKMDKAILSPSKHIPLARLKQIKQDNSIGEGGQEYSEEEINQEIYNRQSSHGDKALAEAKRHEKKMAQQAEDEAKGIGGADPKHFAHLFSKIKKGNIPGGLSEGKKPSDFPKFKLTQGKKVEMEHTTDPKIAEEIAMDHLTEDPKYYEKLKTIEKKPLEKTNQSPIKRGDIVQISNGWLDKENPGQFVVEPKKYVVHGESKRGQKAHWLVPEGEKDSSKGFYHRADRIHPVKKSDSLEKMSRPRITFPQFPDITNRPDQDVKTLENERQKKIYGKQVANAEFRDTKINKPTRLSGTSKVIRSKDELVDAYGKRVAGKFGRNVLGLSHNTPQGPKSAALAGKLRSKFEEGDETDSANIDAYKQKVYEAKNKFDQDYNAWRQKLDQLPSASNAYWEHVANKPKFKKPRRPAKTLKETTSLSPEKMAERGRTVDSTIEHEGFHDTIARIENKYGPVASGGIVRDLISQHNPETIEHVRGFITDALNYKEGKGRFNEELITHARDILVNPVKRQRFKQYLQNKLGMGKDSIISQHIKNLKQGHQKAYERAKNISLADIRPDLAEQPKLAASEMEKGAARRIYGGLDASKLPGRDQVNEWQESVGSIQEKDSEYDEEMHQDARRDIPRMEGGHRLRALNKLSNRTLTRKHPETDKTQYLLFRGVGANEKQAVLDGSFVQHDDHSSWTPKIDTAKGFEGDYEQREDGAKTIAAWIDEDKIHAAPHMYGNMPGLQSDMDNAGKFYTPEKNKPGKNQFSFEHEIVVAPHTSYRATKGDVKRYQAIHTPSRVRIAQSDPKKDLHGRINYRGDKDSSGFKSTKEYPLIRETKPLPSDLISSIKNPKKMAASEEMKKSETAEKETEQINKNKQKPEAKKPHKFVSAKWTHPNGHPRCLICGDEERIGGTCEGLKNE